MDPPHRVGPGPDTPHRHQSYTPGNNMPLASLSRERPPGGPSGPEQWEQATAPTRHTALCAAGLRTPDDDLPPPRLQTATTPDQRSGAQSSSAGTTT